MPSLNIVSLNVSEVKGAAKMPVSKVFLNTAGIDGDAHSVNPNRMITLLGTESLRKIEMQTNRQIECGEFAENITTEGLLLYETKPLDRLTGTNVELEITQIGKECRDDSCSIFNEEGNCIVLKEGVFVRVLRQGEIQVGEQLEYIPKKHRFHIITLSDRAFSGEYFDRVEPLLVEILQDFVKKNKLEAEITYSLIADDRETLKNLIEEKAGEDYDFVLTIGGTGVGPRDITRETIRPLLDKEIPGIMEMIRWKYGKDNPALLLSRGISGTIGKMQIHSFPGSVRACKEYFAEILSFYFYILYMLNGIDVN